MIDKHSTGLLQRYIEELVLELKISRRGRRDLDIIKGALGGILGGKTSYTYTNRLSSTSHDEEVDVRTELNKWFKQIQSIGKKKISPNKAQEIKKFAAETYKKLLDDGENERVASAKTIRAVDKKYAADV